MPITSRRRLAWLLTPLWMWLATPAVAEVLRIDITSREPFGATAGSTLGPCERDDFVESFDAFTRARGDRLLGVKIAG